MLGNPSTLWIAVCLSPLILVISSQNQAGSAATVNTQLNQTIAQVWAAPTLKERIEGAERLAGLTYGTNPEKVDDETVSALVSLLADTPDDAVRYYVASSLGNLGPRAKAAIPTLQKLLPQVECLQVMNSSASAIRGALFRMDVPVPPRGCGFSNEALAPDHLAVYRSVLADLDKHPETVTNLYNHTEPLHWNPAAKQACVEVIDQDSMKAAGQVFHRIPPDVVQGLKFTLIDPDATEWIQFDPRTLVPRVPNRDEVTNKELEDADHHAYDNGARWLSEIAFDKTHRKAVLKVTFDLHHRARNQKTLLLQLKNGQWTETDTCSGRQW
jgi:hypothetical protein